MHNCCLIVDWISPWAGCPNYSDSSRQHGALAANDAESIHRCMDTHIKVSIKLFANQLFSGEVTPAQSRGTVGSSINQTDNKRASILCLGEEGINVLPFLHLTTFSGQWLGWGYICQRPKHSFLPFLFGHFFFFRSIASLKHSKLAAGILLQPKSHFHFLPFFNILKIGFIASTARDTNHSCWTYKLSDLQRITSEHPEIGLNQKYQMGVKMIGWQNTLLGGAYLTMTSRGNSIRGLH